MLLRLSRSQAFLRPSGRTSWAHMFWPTVGLARPFTTDESKPTYHGPLAETCRKLKLFSLASFGLVSAMAPVITLAESSLPMNARLVLCGALVGTSGLSTGVLSWCTAPYVVTLQQKDNGDVLVLETNNLLLQKRFTTVYDWRLFLKGTSRPFAKWELAEEVEIRVDEEMKGGEETVAETKDGEGRVVGRWIVNWGRNGKGTCRGEGALVR